MPSARKKLPRKLPFLLAIPCGCGGPNLSDVYVPRAKHQNAGPAFSHYSRKSANNPHRSSSRSSSCRGDEGGAPSSSCWHSATTSFSQGASNCHSAAPHQYRPPSSSMTKGSRGCRSFKWESVAVVKESADPYLDFHHSMLQMIVEKEIYAHDDLRRLLHCFLSLNSPSNHPTIVHAFYDATSRAGRWGGSWEYGRIT